MFPTNGAFLSFIQQFIQFSKENYSFKNLFSQKKYEIIHSKKRATPENKGKLAFGDFSKVVTQPTLVIWDQKSHFGTQDPHPQNNVQSYHASVFCRTSEAEPGRITLKKRVNYNIFCPVILPREPI